MKLAFCLLLLTNIAVAKQNCASDRALVSMGFEIKSAEQFIERLNIITNTLQTRHLPQIEDNLEFVPELGFWTRLVAFDDPATYDLEMFGDYVLIWNEDRAEFSELRWYENGKMFLAYRNQVCAAPYLPLASNSLY
jgi:hypothetical protein